MVTGRSESCAWLSAVNPPSEMPVKALVLTKPGRFDRIETPELPAPGPGQAVVRIHRVGICGTDLHAFRGHQPFFEYPRILGHELGAEVIALGAGVEHLRIGDQVAVEPYLECGACLPCRQGRYNCCERLQVLGVHVDGGMCERLCVPARKLHRSAILDLDRLALVETLAIGAHAVARAHLETGETVLVVGAGPIGLATALVAQLAGARVFVLERDERRRRVAINLGGILGPGDRGPAGVLGPLDPSTPAAAQLSARCGGEQPTCVFDATGSRASMEAAFAYPAAGGRLVFVGFQPEPLSFANPEFHRRELTLLASRNSTRVEFTPVIGWMEAGRLDPTPWITHRAGYDSLGEIFPSWLKPEAGVVKAVLELG